MFLLDVSSWLLLVGTLVAPLVAYVIFSRKRRRCRAGCVPLRVDPNGHMSMLLVQSRKHPEWFTFPAGGIERGEAADDAACRETREEAGIVGRLGRRICEVQDAKSRTQMFALWVEAELESWEECKERSRQWFDLGVPGSPTAERRLAALRLRLSPNPRQQRILRACESLARDLARDGEQCETSWARPPARLRRKPASPAATAAAAARNR